MNRRTFLTSSIMFTGLVALSGLSCASASAVNENLTVATPDKLPVDDKDKLPFEKIVKTDAEWKKQLTPEQYNVARKAGTEAPYSSPLNNVHDKGTFVCVCCDLPIFSSETKFDSGTGWPSFYQTINKVNVQEKTDKTLSETRTEVLCARCDAHLGHVFDDGPKPTGLRYCMNGVAMKFVKA